MKREAVFAALVDETDALDTREAERGLVHVAALSMTKVADGLVDPKLVLAWLMTALGAPGVLIGVLVPIREAGALVPQIALSRVVEAYGQRARLWSLGAAGQGVAAFAMAASALLLEGTAAGVGIVAGLALLSVSRALCSVTYKDTLAESVQKRRRGSVTGFAGSAASSLVLGFAVLLALDLVPLTSLVIASAIGVAGCLWLAASTLFLTLPEGERAPRKADGSGLVGFFAPLWEDRQLVRFIAARALLTATALAAPFFVMLGAGGAAAGSLGQLGPMMLASAAASIFGSYVWGRLSDRSSRWTLVVSAALGALAMGAAGGIGLASSGLGGLAGTVILLFFMQLAYEGVRAGRKLHLTDMATDDTRARYTAVSNTIIGGVIFAGGLLGILVDAAGPARVLVLLAALCALAVPVALSLDEVQDTSA